MSFEEAKQFLRAEDADGTSLYEHLSKVLLKIIVEKPANANAMFEQLSLDMRAGNYVKPPLKAEGEEEIVKPEKAAQLKWCGTASMLYTAGEGEDATFPDLMTEASVFEWAGVNFGKTETYRLYLSMKQMAQAGGLKLRFWGKIVGRTGDYFVAQGENPEPPAAEDVKKMEGAEGTNKYAFWVCSHAGGEWTKLPNVSPEQIVVARQIRRFFTGQLDAPVPSYPPFPGGGTEAHLLRAQVALITAECSISPEGYYVEDDGADEGIKAIKPAEADEVPEVKSAEELKDPVAWKHHELPINLNGRANQVPAGDDDEAEGDAAEEDLPDLPILATVAEDEPAWALAACPGGAGESPDSIIVAKSLKWPGAVAAAFGNKFLNVYSGFGFPSTRGKPYEPPRVPAILTEWKPETEEDPGLVEDEDKVSAPAVPTEEEDE